MSISMFPQLNETVHLTYLALPKSLRTEMAIEDVAQILRFKWVYERKKSLNVYNETSFMKPANFIKMRTSQEGSMFSNPEIEAVLVAAEQLNKHLRAS